MPTDGGFAFGPFLLDPRSRRVLKNGVPVPMPDRQFDLLHALVRARGATVTKEDLVEFVWKGVAIADNSIVKAVTRLRASLDADPERYVETVSWSGYRMAVPVEQRTITLTAAEIDAFLAPRRAWTTGLAALLTLRRVDLDDAVATFTRLVDYDPTNPEYRVGLANALALKYEMTRTDETPDHASLEKALGHAREARSLNPNYAEAVATLAFIVERIGDREEARTLLRLAVQMQPTNWRITFRRGYGTWGQERIDAAEATLRYFPEFALARVLMATVWVARGVFDEAERQIDAGIASLPRVARDSARYSIVALYYIKGLLCLARGAIDDALQAFQSELALEADGHLYARECSANVWCAIGACHLLRGDNASARVAFGEAIARVPKHPGALAGLAILDGRTAEAAALAASGITLSVNHAVAVAAVLVAAGEHARAAALIETALASAPEDATGWTIPIDPLLMVQQNRDVWRNVLEHLRERAG